jgi:hypothetical protein
MADAATVHVWMVAQARRRAAGPTLARQRGGPAAVPSTRLGLSHPQTHPAAAPTIYACGMRASSADVTASRTGSSSIRSSTSWKKPRTISRSASGRERPRDIR